MAVDTAQKRYSLLGFGSPVPRFLPIPQGTLAADDRALLLYLYSGIALGGAAAETFSGGWGRPARRWPAEETETERRARIKAERVRLGILAPDPVPPAALDVGAPLAGALTRAATRAAPTVSPETLGFASDAADPALALQLAELHTSAWLDAEIRRHFALLDDEDAMFAILALAQSIRL